MSLSPSVCSFLAEMPISTWSGCNSLAGEWGKRVARTWGQWDTQHCVPSQSPWQICRRGMVGQAELEKSCFTAIQSISPSAVNTCCSVCLHNLPHKDSYCPPDPDLPLDYSDKRNIFLIIAMKFLSSLSNC